MTPRNWDLAAGEADQETNLTAAGAERLRVRPAAAASIFSRHGTHRTNRPGRPGAAARVSERCRPASRAPSRAYAPLPPRARRSSALQELFRSRYFCQTEDHEYFELAEPIPGPTTEALAGAGDASSGVVIIASLFEKRAAGLYHNTAAIIDADGRYLGKYRKMHIPDDPLYLRKVLLHAGRPRLPRLGHRSSAGSAC